MSTDDTSDHEASATGGEPGDAELLPVTLRSEALFEIPGLESAVLRECSNDMSLLTLRFAGWGEEWICYLRPVTLLHRGRVLFHGKITSFSHSNDAGDVTTTVVVSNLFWILRRQPLGAQVAEIKASLAEERAAALRQSGVNAMSSWAEMAQSARVEAPGWVVNEDGGLAETSLITLDPSRAGYALGVNVKRHRVLTSWTALLEMQGANPDALFRVNYTSGAIEVISVGQAEELVWDTAGQELCLAGELSALYEDVIAGVAAVVTWQKESAAGTIVATWPEELDLTATGIRIFNASADSASHAALQAANLLRQCKVYYEAVNRLQWGGNVTARLDSLEQSPLCRCLMLQGEGAHASWGEMCAVVTEVEWDFGQGLVSLTLGKQLDDPQLTELQFPDFETGGNGGGGGGGDFPAPVTTTTTTSDPPGSHTPGSTTPTPSTTTTTTTATTTAATTTTTAMGVDFLGFINPETHEPVALQTILESSKPVAIGSFGNQHFDEGCIYACGSSSHPGYLSLHAVYAYNPS